MDGTNRNQRAAVIRALLLIGGCALLLLFADRVRDAFLWAACILFAAEVVYAVRQFRTRIFFLCFLAAFFTFLLGGEILERYFDVFASSFSEKIDRHTDLCLLLSLAALFAGYVISERFGHRVRFLTPRSGTERGADFDGVYCRAVRTVSKCMFYATYAVWLLVLGKQVLFVLANGYLEYYLHYSSGLPQLLHTIAELTPVVFFVFLAAMPSKKEARLPIVLYLVWCVLSLGTGRRLMFVQGFLFVLAYLILRNKVCSRGEVWLSKRMGIAVAIAAPFFLAGMYLFEYIRSDAYVGSASRFNPLLGFFARQGISVNVIKYAERFKSGLNPKATYSFYNMTKFLQTNRLNRYVFHLDFGYDSGGQTVENALHSVSLANYVSYKVSPRDYLRGMGMGSCYIAELYVDFGYAGVVVGNFVYGYLLHTLYEYAVNRRSVWLTALGFFVFDLLVRANRSTFDAFLAEPLYVTFWGTLLFLHLVARQYAVNRK